MSVRILCTSAALWVAACGFSDTAEFGPDANPLTTAGGAGKAGAAATTGGAPHAGAGGVATAGGGRGGVATGGGVMHPVAGDANPPDPIGMGGDGAVGAAGEPNLPPQPVCGNGKIEAGEQCDGGSADHPGCSAACQVVCSDHGRDVLESTDHHCYAGFDEADFEGARQDCTSRGAHLATVSSAAESELVAKLVNDTKFLGGFEDVPLMSEGSGDYRWITGEELKFSNWANAEPDRAESRCGNNGGPGSGAGPGGMRCYEHCIAIQDDGRWADQRCDRADGYVCEWEPLGSK